MHVLSASPMRGRSKARLLARLKAGRGAVVTAEALLAALYGDDADGGPLDARKALAVLICQVRRRLPPGAIRTHWGVGYSLAADVAATLEDLDDRRLMPRERDDAAR